MIRRFTNKKIATELKIFVDKLNFFKSFYSAKELLSFPNWYIMAVLNITLLSFLWYFFRSVISFDFINISGKTFHTILEWTSITIAFLIANFALLHFAIKKDVATVLIALVFISSVFIDTFHTLTTDQFLFYVEDISNFNLFTGFITRLFHALMLIFGVTIMIRSHIKKLNISAWYIFVSGIFLALITYLFIFFSARASTLPLTTFPNLLIKRPYEIIVLFLFVYGAFVLFPRFYKKNPSVFSQSFIIMMIPEIGAELHLIFGSSMTYDSSFIIAHMLKVVAFLTVFLGLCLDYVYSYRFSELTMNNLIKTKAELNDAKNNTQEMLDRRTEELRRHLRELNCHYEISNLVISSNITINDLLQKTCKIIRNLLIYDFQVDVEITCRGERCATSNKIDKAASISQDIFHLIDKYGELNVHLQKAQDAKIKQFLSPHNKILIKTIADRLGRTIERILYKEEIERTNKILKDTRLQLIQAAKLETIGALAAGVAHEVKNSLAIIQQGVDYLGGVKTEDADPVNVIKDIGNAIERADQVIGDLVNFSRSDKLKIADHNINDIINDSLNLLKYEFNKKNVLLELDLGENLPMISVDKNKMEQVVINIVLNALQSVENKGKVIIHSFLEDVNIVKNMYKVCMKSLSCCQSDQEKMIVLQVEDNGVGIPKETLSKIFDTFFSTKAIGKGVGLGLSITQNIIQMHDAAIDIRNKKDGGVIVTIIFCPKQGINLSF